MKSLVWLLDIDHETNDDVSEIRLWGIDNQGRRVVLIDRKSEASFYLLPNSDTKPERLVAEVRSVKARYPGIVDVSIENAHFFGKPVDVVKVVCNDAARVSDYAKSMAKIEGVKEHLEDDLRPSYRYLLDHDLQPCGWHQVDIDKQVLRSELKVDAVYELKCPPARMEKHSSPSLRILTFTIISFSERGTPKPKSDPIVLLSVATSDGKEKQFVANDRDDRRIVAGFVAYVQSYDPDMIVGFGSNSIDWPYLIGRAKAQNLRLGVGRTGAEPHRSVYGHMSVAGRANIDLNDVAEGIPGIKVKTLWNFLNYLGILPKKGTRIVEDFEFSLLWRDPEKRSQLQEFLKECASGILEATKETSDYMMQLSSLTGMPLDYVITAPVGFRVDSYLMKQARKLQELIPRKIEQPYLPYRGAIVLEPTPGIHDKIAVLDFTSMYPNLMIIHNISPDTLLESGSSSVNYVAAPEVGHKFRKEPPGFYKSALLNLISTREEVKRELAKLDPNSSQYEILRDREKAVKVIANATYGYAGWVGARWYVREVAESTAAYGRATLLKAIDMAKEIGLEIVYGDTDSIFVKHEPKKVEKLLSRVKQDLGMEVKVDKIYERAIFTEAKKRYAGLLANGKLDVVGMEAVRGDWAEIAKKVQEKVLELVLKDNNERRALDYLMKMVDEVRTKRLPFDEFIVWKTLTKRVEEYEVRSAHVEVAKKLMNEGWELSVGDKIGFIIAKRSGRLYQKAQPYSSSTIDDIDVEYYVNSQVVPVAMRVLSVLGIKEENLNIERRTESLTDFA